MADESLYLELLDRVRSDLADSIRRRTRLMESTERANKEIAELKSLIGGIHTYIDESEENNDPFQTRILLKRAVTVALLASGREVTLPEILTILQELQYPIESYRDPLGSVSEIVAQLVSDGDVASADREVTRRPIAGQDYGRVLLRRRYSRSSSLRWPTNADLRTPIQFISLNNRRSRVSLL